MAIIPGVYQAKNAISDNSQQGAKFNSIVNAIVNPANTSLLTEFDPVIEEVSSPNAGTVVTYMPQTVSGTPPLALPNSAGQPLQAWAVDLLPYQEGTGDPSPSNVRAIHGTDKINIVTAGDNLLVPNFVQGSAIGIGEYNRITANILIPIVQGKTYTFSASDYTNFYYVLNSGQNNRLPFPYSPPVAYQWCGHNVSWVQHDITFTATRSGYLAVVVHNAANNTIHPEDVTNVKMKFEESALSTDWTPNAVSTSITLPQTVYTATISEQGGESRSAEIDMGNMTWDRVGSTGRFYSGSIRTLVKAGSDADGYDNAFAETYKAQNVASLSFLSDNCMSVDTSGNLQLYDSSKAGMTGAELKTALTGIKMVYKLATPTTFAVPSVTIPTPTGTATAWATAEDGTVESMSVTYVGKA